MTKELAEGILALDFPEADVVRADELNAKANDGTLSEEEQVELEAYVSIADCSRTGSRRLVRFTPGLTEELDGARCKTCKYWRRSIPLLTFSPACSSTQDSNDRQLDEIANFMLGPSRRAVRNQSFRRS